MPVPRVVEGEDCTVDNATTMRVLDELCKVASPNIQRTLSLSSPIPHLLSSPYEVDVQEIKAKHGFDNQAPTSCCAAIEDNVLRREGDYWTIIYAGTVIHIRDTQGLRYLALLLRTPHRRLPAYQLVTLARGIDET